MIGLFRVEKALSFVSKQKNEVDNGTIKRGRS